MWQSKKLGLDNMLEILVEAFQSTVAVGYEGFDRDKQWTRPYEDFRQRFKRSYGSVLNMEAYVSTFFENDFKETPPPGHLRLAVLASGSASRLEFFHEILQPIPLEGILVPDPKSRKESESDFDLLCVVDGCDPLEKEWQDRMKRLAAYLKRFDVLLDGMSDPPRTVTRNDLLGYPKEARKRRKMLARRESKLLETWRYWIAFESVALYTYPLNQAPTFAERLETTLVRDHFGADLAQRSKTFPLLWYHAACRYMCGIYLDIFRELLREQESKNRGHNPPDPKEMIQKVVKLKTARLLTWCVAIMNALVVHQMTVLGSPQRPVDAIWAGARVPGLIPSFRLQNLLEKAVKAMAQPRAGAVNQAARSISDLQRRSEAAELSLEGLAEIRRNMLISYALYFQWLEQGRQFLHEPTISDVNELLYGRPIDCLPFSKQLVDLIVHSSRLFRQLSQVSAIITNFSPDFLFY